ncbi:MAG TPA: MATE family efflux transporter [Capillibacterium sp.]
MNDLTVGNEAKKILFFAFPILLSNIFQQLYNIVDAIIVGRLLGEKELAAVGAAITLYSVILAVALGLTLGLSILISIYFGERNSEKIKKAVSTGIIVSMIITIFITLTGVVFSKPLLSMVNVPENIINLSNTYLVVLFSGMFTVFGYNLFTNVLRGLGDTKSSLYILILSSVLNIFLDLLFVYFFKWSVFGAALATVLAQFFSLVTV